MFGRILLTQMKASLRSRRFIFWTLAFPILLGTLFYFAFGAIYDSQKSDTIPVVIEVSEEAIHEYKVMQAFSNLDRDGLSEDYSKYSEDKAIAEAMGESFDEEPPIDDDTLDNLDTVKSYENMKDFDLSMFPYDYLKVDQSEIDSIDKNDLPFMKLMEKLEYDNGTKMIEIIEVSDKSVGLLDESERAEAEKLMSDGDIAGIITVNSMTDIKLLANGNGVKHSILSNIISKYKLEVDKAIDTINSDEDKLEQSDEILDASSKTVEFIESNSMAGDNKDPFVAYFYNLIAMVCIMGAITALNVIVNNQANQSDLGIRIDVSPAVKILYELAQLTAVIILQMGIVTITLTYLIFILKIQFGGDIGMIYLTALLGSLVGDTLGFMIAHFGRISLDKKESILMVIMLGGGFMSGLMYADMKMIVEQKFPIFNRINPSAVISDAFYTLNVFGVGPRYYRSIIYVIVTSLVMLLIGCVLSRRNSYKSL